MSAIGTLQTLTPMMSMSASEGKADIPDTAHHCPLMTQSGRDSAFGCTRRSAAFCCAIGSHAELLA